MGSSRGKKQEREAEQRLTTAYNEYKADPMEDYRRKRTMKFMQDWDSGKDVRDMEALSPVYNLFQNAKNSQDNQMVGRGVAALGQNPNTDRVVTDQDRYLQAQREQDAAGMLYDTANAMRSDAQGESDYLINTSQNRLANRVGMAQNWYSTLVNRPKRPPLWERIAGLTIQAGQAAARAFSGGMPGMGG